MPHPNAPVPDAEMDEWLSLFANRNEVAEEYARALRIHGVNGSYDYAPFNHAILRRWSPAGLRYITERAWKIATKGQSWRR